MKDSLVSLLTPCYNAGHLIGNLLDSVLLQTYPSIEMIVVDDGSTDNSREIILSYIQRFNSRGYTLTYVYQENSGQSVAIRSGLKLIKGEYLAWPDSDDYYATHDAIEILVNKLQELPNRYAVVRSCQNLVDAETMEQICVQGVGCSKEDLFEDCLYGQNGFYWGAGAYMLRTMVLFETTELDIYTEKNAGQNWQLLLPLLYSYKCYTINEILYTVLVRNVSHGRGAFQGYDRLLMRKQTYENTILGTLNRMRLLTNEQLQLYKFNVQCMIVAERLELAYSYGQYGDYIKFFKRLKIDNPTLLKRIDLIRYFAIKTKTTKLLNVTISIYRKLYVG